MIPRSGGSSFRKNFALADDSLLSETASSSTVGRGGGVRRGPRLRLRLRSCGAAF